MIRELHKADINAVADIWLEANLKAHNFISAEYWKSNFELVKELLQQAEVYVYENNHNIEGFVGLSDEYIDGIFVCDGKQSHGIGKCLLDYIKDRKSKLYLNVYQKNVRAIHFYKSDVCQDMGVFKHNAMKKKMIKSNIAENRNLRE